VAKAHDKSFPGVLWTLVTDNPKLASAVAFEVGYIAGKLTGGTAMKNIKFSPEFASVMPQLAQAALALLPAAAASLQPSAPKHRKSASRKSVKRPSRRPKARPAA
jgi:hypothetical protein